MHQAPSEPDTLILGIGNLLLSDEGLGPRLIRWFEVDSGPNAPFRCLDGGTLGFTLATDIAACARLIVVDAAALGEPPGTLRVFEDAVLDAHLRAHARSVHEVGLADLLDIARLTGSLPQPRALVTVAPERVDWGEHLSPPVEAALPAVTAAIHALLRRWGRRSTRKTPRI
ncbi:hydrogenase maturation protease [Marichromatium bheemlicum]|uniref:Hydrogenase maturation protease n=1 Tax=Marichromatium bheemlicum TaxID=365339 RepID=A0ABX1I7G2_9GAMM|nr:hydrogenase maturation protease [Marichromatium bheemlicum]NKN33515.1 hydrogenase maturation protease [Marichromatium bheemlicum]